MKKTLLQFTLLLALLGTGCASSSSTATNDEKDSVLIGRFIDGEVELAMTETRLMALVRGAFVENDDANPVLEAAYVEGSGDYYYLVADGQYPDGNDKKMAFELARMKSDGGESLLWRK